MEKRLWQVASFLDLWRVVKRKITPSDCHPALVAGSGDKTTDGICGSRSPRKAGITGQWMWTTPSHQAGFTLIEISIVLVIIGLIVGGVLVGKDLISAAEIRSQISQIEKYNAAVHSFQLKYNNHLPGDIPNPDASAFGFAVRGTLAGQGDGNGAVQGYINTFGVSSNAVSGENTMFWVDLSVANLIDGGLYTATPTNLSNITAANVPLYFPKAKIGNRNFVYVTGSAPNYIGTMSPPLSAYTNYFTISISYGSVGLNQPDTNVGLSVNQAFMLDSKVDDSLPQSGNVLAVYPDTALPSTFYYWAGTNVKNSASYTTATPASATTCFDNGGVAGVQKYSIGYNGGNGINCALSFKFK